MVFQYIDAPLPAKGKEQFTEEKRRLKALVRQVEKYEKMERLSLLELAILKSQRCFRNEESEECPPVKGGASIIIPFVKEFLGYSCKK
jgi:hypothetical protein